MSDGRRTLATSTRIWLPSPVTVFCMRATSAWPCPATTGVGPYCNYCIP